MKKHIRALILSILLALLTFTVFSQETKVLNLGFPKIGQESLNYLSLGTSLSAGVRNGGVYAEAQNGSFPSLLARQMGLVNWRVPTLPKSGTGRDHAVILSNGLLDIYHEKGKFDDTTQDSVFPKIEGVVDNYAIPYQKVLDILKSNKNDVNQNYDNRSFKYLERFSEENHSLFYFVKERIDNVDFFTFEFGFHDFIQFAQSGGYQTDISFICDREIIGEKILLDLLTDKTPYGVVLNVPNYLNFPIYKMYSSGLMDENEIFIEHWQKSDVRAIDLNDIMLPKGSVLEYFSGGYGIGSFENPLKDEDILDVEEQRFASVTCYNNLLKKFANDKGLVYVDLESLFDEIIDGTYSTKELGLIINPDYPNGNFFSSDGLTPTALGQAIITNRIIKSINTAYKSNIPLLDLHKF